MLTDTQKQTAQAIVNVFETGAVRGRYGQVTLIEGDTGQLTFGRSQTTLTSGNLFKLIDDYCRRDGALHAERLLPYLTALNQQDPNVNGDLHFHNLLRATADDPVMRETQDEFFEATYWASAGRITRRDGIATPLGVAVVYDSRVHGSWTALRRRVNDDRGRVADLGEREWIAAYVETRHDWLANHRRRDLRNTVYRMETFRELIAEDAWMLELPLEIRGLTIDLTSLLAPPPDVYDGPPPRSREIVLSSPPLRGLDVRLVQVALSEAGRRLVADGVYGSKSRGAVEEFQRERELRVTGTVGGGDFDALGF